MSTSTKVFNSLTKSLKLSSKPIINKSIYLNSQRSFSSTYSNLSSSTDSTTKSNEDKSTTTETTAHTELLEKIETQAKSIAELKVSNTIFLFLFYFFFFFFFLFYLPGSFTTLRLNFCGFRSITKSIMYTDCHLSYHFRI